MDRTSSILVAVIVVIVLSWTSFVGAVLISGKLFFDLDLNGIFNNNSDIPVTNARIQLRSCDSESYNVYLAGAVSEDNGQYSFQDVSNSVDVGQCVFLYFQPGQQLEPVEGGVVDPVTGKSAETVLTQQEIVWNVGILYNGNVTSVMINNSMAPVAENQTLSLTDQNQSLFLDDALLLLDNETDSQNNTSTYVPTARPALSSNYDFDTSNVTFPITYPAIPISQPTQQGSQTSTNVSNETSIFVWTNSSWTGSNGTNNLITNTTTSITPNPTYTMDFNDYTTSPMIVSVTSSPTDIIGETIAPSRTPTSNPAFDQSGDSMESSNTTTRPTRIPTYNPASNDDITVEQTSKSNSPTTNPTSSPVSTDDDQQSSSNTTSPSITPISNTVSAELDDSVDSSNGDQSSSKTTSPTITPTSDPVSSELENSGDSSNTQQSNSKTTSPTISPTSNPVSNKPEHSSDEGDFKNPATNGTLEAKTPSSRPTSKPTSCIGCPLPLLSTIRVELDNIETKLSDDAKSLFENVCSSFLNEQLSIATPPVSEIECVVIKESFETQLRFRDRSLRKDYAHDSISAQYGLEKLFMMNTLPTRERKLLNVFLADVNVTGTTVSTPTYQKPTDIKFKELCVGTFTVQGFLFVRSLKAEEEERNTADQRNDTTFQAVENARGVMTYDAAEASMAGEEIGDPTNTNVGLPTNVIIGVTLGSVVILVLLLFIARKVRENRRLRDESFEDDDLWGARVSSKSMKRSAQGPKEDFFGSLKGCHPSSTKPSPTNSCRTGPTVITPVSIRSNTNEVEVDIVPSSFIDDNQNSSLQHRTNGIPSSSILNSRVRRDVIVPPGKLGLLVSNTAGYGPAVHTVREGSPVEGRIHVNDIIIAVDDINTMEYNATELMQMMMETEGKRRKITVLSSNG